MDSLSQLLLGASVGAACLPREQRRLGLLLGAALGTLPDLDVVPLNLLVHDPLARTVWHRGASHSLFVLVPFGLLLWVLGRRWIGAVRAAPLAHAVGIQAVLVSHVLLDALTIYGTQLLWPLPVPPTMVGSVFIIDPLYTVWLLGGAAIALWAGPRAVAKRALLVGLLLSTAYLGWSLYAKGKADRQLDRALAELGHPDAPRFTVPMPFQTLLWRGVAILPEGYAEGLWSMVAPGDRFALEIHPRGERELDQVLDLAAPARLLAWNRGFVRADVEAERLVLSDLRMGAHPDYFFRFAVAERSSEDWRPIEPVQYPISRDVLQRLPALWARLWTAQVE